MSVQRPDRAVYWRELVASAWENCQQAKEAADTAPPGIMQELDDLGAKHMAAADYERLVEAAVEDIAGDGDKTQAEQLLNAAVRTALIARA
jgi:hypothetical protein